MKAAAERDRFIRSKKDPGGLPSKEEDIAFAPITQLSQWIEQRKLSSERLTHLYLGRLEKFDPKLRWVITLTRDLALKQAKKAARKLLPASIAGRYMVFHGVPRTFSIPMGFPRRMVLSRLGIASPRKML
jgi:hypothetical protein